MITPRNLDGRPAIVRRAMRDLMAAWPVGQPVRHVAGWTGRVVVDFARNPHSLTGSADSHCLADDGPTLGCVCVQRDADGMTAWYFPRTLSPLGAKVTVAPAAERPAPKPAPSTTTRRRTRGRNS